MVFDNRRASLETIPVPGLVIVTGASHAGKTTAAEMILAELQGTVAYLAVDEILGHTLPTYQDDVWSQIPLAYDLILSQLPVLFARNWFVVVESTFTYVPASGSPEFHSQALERLVETATSRGLPVFVVHLQASKEALLSRARLSGRLDPAIVAGTLTAHGFARFPLTPLTVDTDRLGAGESAESILRYLKRPRSR